MPSFIVKNGPENRHKNVAVFAVFLVSSFSMSCLFPLVSPYFLLFHAILEPQNSPPSEVTGIYIYMLDSRQRVHLTPFQKASSGSTKNLEKLLSAEWSLLSDGSWPELAPLWAPNRLSNWSFLTHFFASLILLETPYFIVFLYQFQFKMSKFEAQFWSKFQTLETQFELLSGRFVDPELPFNISPQI